MSLFTPILRTAPCIKKAEKPILTKDDIPYNASLVFNAGVAKYQGKYVMIFRDDYNFEENVWPPRRKPKTILGVAFSEDGITWSVRKEPLFDSASLPDDSDFRRFYDPRLTIIEGKPYVCLAMDTRHGIRGAIAEINDTFDQLNILSISAPDNRNMVLFPERIGGLYVRLERPFPVYSRGGKHRFDLWMSKSPDLRYWGDTEMVLGVEHVPFANDKIGPAAPPIKTKYGWLTTFHAVDFEEGRGKNGWEPTWERRYTAGIMLLDLDDPTKVIGMSKEPLIAPDLPLETDEGFRQHVIFPGGMILEDDETVKIYYGASDTVECVATASLSDLVALCTETK